MPARICLFEPEIYLNVGAIMRTCACFGLKLDLIEPCGFPFSHDMQKTGKDKRSAMDYVEYCQVELFMDLESYVAQFPNVIGIVCDGKLPYYDINNIQDDAIFIFGKESVGIPPQLYPLISQTAYIPMPGQGRSLNLASSVAIIASWINNPRCK